VDDGVTVRVQDLSTGYGRRAAVEGLSFEARAGRLLGVLGPNGSGKSTLIKTLMGLLPAWSGSIEVLGTTPAKARPRMGYVPQTDEVDWDFPVSVREVVAMGLYRRRAGFSRFVRVDGRAVTAALERMRMAEFAGRQVGELSGGQRRRVLLARALVREPSVLVLDEPAAGLDATAEAELLELLRATANGGTTVIVATHDIQGVYDVYDDALLINHRALAFGPAKVALSDAVLHEAFGRQLIAFHEDEHHHVEVSH